jgi:YHS domain-containing protein
MGMRTLFILVFVLALGILYGCSSNGSAKLDAGAAQLASQSSEQKTCPITGAPIDKNIYIVYQGKKVYFSCECVKKTFEKNPEQYIGQLPQFAKSL